MVNLYEELIENLKYNNKTLDDIEYIITNEWDIPTNKFKLIEIPKEHFLKLAKETNYDNGFGLPEIDTNLKVVGKDWWLERVDYDGEEWFEFKKLPDKPNEIKYVETI